ncbi:hypothetical protein [Ectobacillus antri]|uniref:hypothetical protein n=1 Tax=Ectobacillus antri TaxID=2486280 RepID=UPI000F5B26C7|nr:hypothetical protein [Ectobacillus antri]
MYKLYSKKKRITLRRSEKEKRKERWNKNSSTTSDTDFISHSEDICGRWDKHSDWKEIAFFPHVLRGQLEKFSDKVDEILYEWREGGWIVDQNNGFTKKVKINGKYQRMIAISREAAEMYV